MTFILLAGCCALVYYIPTILYKVSYEELIKVLSSDSLTFLSDIAGRLGIDSLNITATAQQYLTVSLIVSIAILILTTIVIKKINKGK